LIFHGKKQVQLHSCNLGNHFRITNVSSFAEPTSISVKAASCYNLHPSLCSRFG